MKTKLIMICLVITFLISGCFLFQASPAEQIYYNCYCDKITKGSSDSDRFQLLNSTHLELNDSRICNYYSDNALKKRIYYGIENISNLQVFKSDCYHFASEGIYKTENEYYYCKCSK